MRLRTSSSKPKILLVGDACVDVYMYGECTRLSPEAPVPILDLDRSETRPGMANNVKANLIALGCDVMSVTTAEPPVKKRYVDASSMTHVLRVDQHARRDDTITEPDFGFLEAHTETADALVISDYAKGFLSHEHVVRLCQMFRAKTALAPIIVDSKRSDLSCFDAGCIIKLNEVEDATVEVFPDSCHIITTLGSRGAKYGVDLFPAKPVEVFDVCGAGDTFLAAFTAHYVEHTNIAAAIRYANEVAAIAVTHFGTYVVSKDEVHKE